MKVRLPQKTIYDQQGHHWWTEEIVNPEWSMVEQAIRRLDQFQYPFIWLFLNPDACEDSEFDYFIMGARAYIRAVASTRVTSSYTLIPTAAKNGSRSGRVIKAEKQGRRKYALILKWCYALRAISASMRAPTQARPGSEQPGISRKGIASDVMPLHTAAQQPHAAEAAKRVS